MGLDLVHKQIALENIYKHKNEVKKNFLYLDWPFGGYIFDEMLKAQYENINLIKFSLFDIFNKNHRLELINSFNANTKEYIDTILEIIEQLRPDGLLVTTDWPPFQTGIISIFKKQRIPVAVILHEGVFQNVNRYYEAKVPVSDRVLVWGELHKNIFIERGYPEKHIRAVGSIKLNKYKTFKSSISFDDFINIYQLNEKQRTIMYCCQLCDNQWHDQELALSKQREVMNDIRKIAEEHGYNFVIRNAPAQPDMVLPIEFLKEYENHVNVFIDGRDVDSTAKSSYKIKAEDALYYCDLVVGLNTTMQLEASLLSKPSLVAHYFDFDPKWHTEIGLPKASNYQELEELIIKYINSEKSLISTNRMSEFCENYGLSEDLAYSPLENIERELMNLCAEWDKKYLDYCSTLESVPSFNVIRFELTNICGYKCVMCPRDLTRSLGYASKADIAKLAERIKNPEQIKRIELVAHGEPLLVDDLIEKASYIKSFFSNTGTILIITTLGYELSDDYLEKLVNSDINYVRVSFYGADRENYKRIHGVDKFDLAYNNIKRLIATNNKFGNKLFIKIHFFRQDGISGIDLPNNAAMFDTLEHELINLGLDKKNFGEMVLHNYGKGKDISMVGKDRVCSVAFADARNWLQISVGLNVIPCSFVYDNEVIFGNLNTQSLEEIFSSKCYKDFQRALLANDLHEYPSCVDCNKYSAGYNNYLPYLKRYLADRGEIK